MTPNPTGTSAGPSASNAQTPSVPQPQPQSQSSSSSQTYLTSANSPQNETNAHQRDRSPTVNDLATELEMVVLEDSGPSEPPPAYTPAANPYEGEATVEYGPRRPFQPAPPAPPLPQHLMGTSQGGYSMSPQATGLPIIANPTGGWGQYPGQASRGYEPSGLGPPPRHPSSRGRSFAPEPRVSSAPSAPSRPLSAFARDFYTSTPNEQRASRIPSPVPSDRSSDDTHEPENFERTRPAITTSSSYAPPPGPPPAQFSPPSGPPPVSPVTTSPYTPPSEPPPPRPSRGGSNNTDEWKPTSSPTPGRPLLNRGRVLAANGYSFSKGLNTGYKNFDPSHPCRKCWERYAKPYGGAIMYAPRNQQSQRPLPSFRPPHLRHQQSRSQPSLLHPPSPSSSLSRSQSAHRPGLCPSPNLRPGGYPGRAVSNPGPGGLFPPAPQLMQMPRPHVNLLRGQPPPGSTVVQPGDARIGGRLCWRSNMKSIFGTTAVLAAASMCLAFPVKRSSPTITDEDVFNFALTLELVEVSYYTTGLSMFSEADFASSGLPDFARGRFVEISENEQEHARVLTAALGPNATQPCNYSFPFTDVKGFATLSATLEQVGTSAYTGAAPLLSDATHIIEAAAILATEARQSSFVMSTLLKQNPWSTSFETPLDMDQAFSLAAGFIVSCPSTNPVLPIRAFPGLNVTTTTPTPGQAVSLTFDRTASGAATTTADTQLFLTLLSGIGKLAVPVTADGSSYSATLPENLQGTVYGLITNTNATAKDEDTVAGVAILNFPFNSTANEIEP
ncbi:hypothetical protein EW145_g2617 [Phellinidium pouzarii]|uniref:Uncharacterized protein n=1 Tax=Phellinidium pouzarii TaxID=167371 RepID=A0A4S4LBM8_9AGAM|nr:hypothetical protein EW145_g2617 [Phellinidium pouzarii]